VATALVIFDCDGVLVDSDLISLRIQAKHITALGLPTTYEDCVRDFLGIGVPATRTRRDRRLHLGRL
jgi:beta-phosphoglucomutase-like phosphatase (HAD superfamily)